MKKAFIWVGGFILVVLVLGNLPLPKKDPASYDDRIASNAWAPMQEKHGPKLWRKLGDGAIQTANMNGRKAARYFARRCNKVELVDVSEKSTRREIVYFAHCDGESKSRFATLSEIKEWHDG